MTRTGARELIDLVLDEGSFVCWDRPIDISRHPLDYRHALEAAARKAGTDEAVITGEGTVRGRRVAVVVSEFRFLAGSIGRATADRIVAAVRRATALRLPLMASTASGGTRMQEGTPAFLQMIEITRALVDHRQAGLPYLAHLRHPTTGGVYASWGSLAHVTVAEPGALVGFLGPKVFEALRGEPFPEDVQTAENLVRHGVIDAAVPAEELAGLIDSALAVLTDAPDHVTVTADPDLLGAPPDAWDAIERTRAPGRAGVRDLLRHAGKHTLRLRGTDEGESDASVLVALTRLAGQPCVLVGQDRTRQDESSAMGAGALREARRGMRLADELGIPLVTVVDTPGAELSRDAEEGAIAGEIARCIAAMSALTVPSVSILLGQGCGGGALALMAGDTVIATESSWLTPLPPEGASVILHGTTERAPEIARAQKIRAVDLFESGDVDQIIPEPHDAGVEQLALAVAKACALALAKDVSRAPRRLPSLDLSVLELASQRLISWGREATGSVRKALHDRPWRETRLPGFWRHAGE